MSKNRDRFIRLAEIRVNKAIKYIELTKNLSNRSNYEYTEQDYKDIVTALGNAVREVKVAFESKGNVGSNKFELKKK